MTAMEEMRKLVDKLNYFTQKYDEGHPEITDKEWDNLYFQLLTLEKETNFCYKDSPTQNISYEVVNSLPKIQHNHKMLSLDKTKSVEDVQNFIGNHDYVAMAKMDGLTCSLHYSNGKLITAETRGNGIIGEDITHNAKVIPSIPNELTYKYDLTVDGEIVCLDSDFQNFSVEYKNSRNFAAGSIRLLDAKECARRRLTFIAWDVIEGFEQETSFVKKLSLLEQYGFKIVPWVQENISSAIGDIQDFCLEHGYPIDGVVFKFDDIAFGKSQGETNHHFKNAIAYKFYDEEYETELINIEYTMGRTGQLTPVAIYKDIDIDGSICNRASLHNLNIMGEILGSFPYKGEKIWIYKANMIIPQISKAEKRISFEDYHFEIPKVCPICGKPTQIITSDTDTSELYCTNALCEGKLINQINHFLGKKGLDVKGISEATLEKLIDWGWVNSILDIYNLEQYKNEWIIKPGFGKKSVENNLNAIAASKICQLDKFICALGIPLIGTSMSKTLANTFKTWENFRNAIKTSYDFSLLEDFGDITSDAILNFDYTQADSLATILTIEYNEPMENVEKQSLSNMKIAITGTLQHFKNRGELEQVIAAAGGKSVSSVTKNTTLLINNDKNSTSSKNKTAKQFNIPILTEEEFLEKYID